MDSLVTKVVPHPLYMPHFEPTIYGMLNYKSVLESSESRLMQCSSKAWGDLFSNIAIYSILCIINLYEPSWDSHFVYLLIKKKKKIYIYIYIYSKIWHFIWDNVPVWIARFARLRFFFFSQNMNSKITWIYYAETKHCSCTVVVLFIHLKILKMGPTVLFTHLKIILLQYFQFSISTTISSTQMDPMCPCLYITDSY